MKFSVCVGNEPQKGWLHWGDVPDSGSILNFNAMIKDYYVHYPTGVSAFSVPKVMVQPFFPTLPL